MRIKTLCGGILLLSGVFMFPSPGFSAAPEPQSEEAKQIVSLVEKAAALIETQGKEAFPEFRRKDSEWYNPTLTVPRTFSGTCSCGVAYKSSG